jgi:hypothetical protein
LKIAILILVHRLPAQAIRLIQTLLHDKDITVFVHVDLKSPEVFDSLYSEFSGNANVVFTPLRCRVYWGSYNQIRATLELMKTARAHQDFDYYSLVSGQDLPIKPLHELKDYLKKNSGKEFIVHFKLPDPGNWGGNGGLDRLQLYWLDAKIPRYSFTYRRINDFIHKIQKRFNFKRKLKYELYGGFNWFTLSGIAVSYILNYLNEDKRYLKRYKFTSCADEIFIQTILMNSPLKENVVNADLRYINWASGPEYPKIMRMDDFETLINSQDKFFARKFDPAKDERVIDQIVNLVTERKI